MRTLPPGGQPPSGLSVWRGSSEPMISLRLVSISMSSFCHQPPSARSAGMNESSGFGFEGSLTSIVLKPKRPVRTRILPSNFPSTTRLVSGIHLTYSRLDDICAPGGGFAADAVVGMSASAASAAAIAPALRISPLPRVDGLLTGTYPKRAASRVRSLDVQRVGHAGA